MIIGVWVAGKQVSFCTELYKILPFLESLFKFDDYFPPTNFVYLYFLNSLLNKSFLIMLMHIMQKEHVLYMCIAMRSHYEHICVVVWTSRSWALLEVLHTETKMCPLCSLVPLVDRTAKVFTCCLVSFSFFHSLYFWGSFMFLHITNSPIFTDD